MSFSLAHALPVACLAACAPGSSEELSTSFAVASGADNDADGAVGSLLFVPETRGGGRRQSGICSGTLISPRFLLTARHCVESQHVDPNAGDDGGLVAPDDLFVAWDTQLGPESRLSRVVGHAIHEHADIAIVELQNAPAGKRPVPVNAAPLESRVGVDGRVAGFGITSFRRSDSGTRRSGAIHLRDVVDWPAMGHVILLENTHGNQLCPGDSGGPTFLSVEGQDAVAGVNSFILGACERPDTLGFAVRTDKYTDFIQDTIAERGGEPPTLVISDDPAESTASSGGCQTGGPGGAWLLLPLVLLLSWRRRAW